MEEYEVKKVLSALRRQGGGNRICCLVRGVFPADVSVGRKYVKMSGCRKMLIASDLMELKSLRNLKICRFLPKNGPLPGRNNPAFRRDKPGD